MAILPTPNLDFSDKDFQSLRFRLQGLVRSVFPDWTDFNVDNFGNILLELFAFTGDVLNFYQDNQAREAFFPTLTQRLSAIRLGRLIGFRLTSASPATGTIRYSLPSPTAVQVTVPLGHRTRAVGPSPNPPKFRTTSEVIIPIGQSFVDAPAEQAEVRTEAFGSPGTPNFEILLSNAPYIDTTAQLTAANGTYAEIDSFLNAGPNDLVFVVLVDQNDKARVRFGNGTNGVIPQGAINVDYKVGGGSAGNVEANTVTVLEEPVNDIGSGTAFPLRVTNANAFSGGVDRMSVAQAKALAPLSLRSLTRSVTKDDFENNAVQISGVARALMATRNEDAAIPENTGRLQVVAQGVRLSSGRIEPAVPSQTLLDAVETMVTVTRPQTLTFVVIVEAATFKTVNVSARIFLGAGAVGATVAAAIRDALRNLFAAQLEDGAANSDIDFGANLRDAQGLIVPELPWSTVFNAIRDVTGIRKLDEGPAGLLLNGSRISITLTPREFPKLGLVTIEDADTGAPL